MKLDDSSNDQEHETYNTMTNCSINVFDQTRRNLSQFKKNKSVTRKKFNNDYMTYNKYDMEKAQDGNLIKLN